MAKDDNLGLQPRLRLEGRSQETKPSPQRLPDLTVDYRVDRVFNRDRELDVVMIPGSSTDAAI
jgi:hypothetical protein